jgi:hypothetical protein
MVYTHGGMKKHMLVNGKMANKMEVENKSTCRVAISMMASG